MRIILLMVMAVAALAENVYKLSDVKRVDQDLYRSGSTYVETQFCYHYTYGETAVLKWDGFKGTIIWDDNSKCAVKRVFTK